MNRRDSIYSLINFVKRITSDGVFYKTSFRKWCKDHEQEMETFFGYFRKEGMPAITSLVGASFHPTEPLIMLNYTAGTHNTLHKFPEGWTLPLRQCRGIVFDMVTGQLIAKPFEKFFNYGEHPETVNLPGGPFVATVKHDGHLGIIFRYHDKFILTTRGEFVNPTAQFAQAMLDEYVEGNGWMEWIPPGQITLLVEVIHPKTRVFLDYYADKRFVLLGINRNSGEYDVFDYPSVCVWGNLLGLDVAEQWVGDSLEVLREHMRDLSVKNREGYVVRVGDRMVKFKFASYINKMVEAKLGYKYLMQRVISGNLGKMIDNLPEEVFAQAQEMLRALMNIAQNETFTDKEKKKRLYKLVPIEESTQYYRKICRDFLARMNTT